MAFSTRILYTMMLFVLLATATNALSYGNFQNNGWTTYQKTYNNLGLDYSLMGGWNVNNYTGYPTSLSIGRNEQPLIYDFDNDSTKEIFISSGKYIYFASVNNASNLVVEKQYNIGTLIHNQSVMVNDANNNGFPEVLFFNSTSITQAEYNGTDITIQSSIPYSDTMPGMKCFNQDQTGINETHCYGMNSSMVFHDYNAVNHNMTLVQNSTSISVITRNSYNGNPIIPSFWDIENDGILEMIMPCVGSTATYIRMCVFDTTTGLLDNYFSTDGLSPDISCGANSETVYPASSISYNANNLGDSEIFMNYFCSGGISGMVGDSKATAYSGDGTLYASITFFDDLNDPGDTTYSSPMILGYFNQTTTDEELCTALSYVSGGNTFYKISCYDTYLKINTLSYPNVLQGGSVQRQSAGTIISADADGDTHSDIIISGGIIYRINQTAYNWTAFNMNANLTTYSTTSSMSASDMNGDGFSDYCGEQSGFTYCALSNVINNLPSLASIQTAYSTICVNSTQNFWATQDIDYTNDYSTDSERLVSDCDTGTTYLYGTYDLAEPTFSCYYNVTGNYMVKMYLQDNHNANNYDQSLNIPVTVINGIAGTDCNKPGTGSSTGTAPSADTGNLAIVNNIFDQVTEGSFYLKLILVFGIVIMVVIGVGKHVPDNLALQTVSGIVAFIIGILLVFGSAGLWILIFIAIFMALFLILGKYLIGSNAGSGGH